MSMCEKCWADAYGEMMRRGGSQTEHYQRLLKERTSCTPEEMAGQWWDPVHQRDSRELKAKRSSRRAGGEA